MEENMRNRLFWGIVLILLGLIFLFGYQMGLPVWRLIWPFMIIAIGAWILLIPVLSKGMKVVQEDFSLPVEGVEQATLKIEHGAGKINLHTVDLKDQFLTGSFMGGVAPKASLSQGKYRVKLESKIEFANFLPRFQNREQLSWDISINRTIPLKVKMETGASDNYLDFTNAQLEELHLETGASSTEILLPEGCAFTSVHVESGASAIKIHIPQKVAARIKISGLIGKTIDTDRFIQNGEQYESPDYEKAKNRVEINVESGVGSVEID